MTNWSRACVVAVALAAAGCSSSATSSGSTQPSSLPRGTSTTLGPAGTGSVPVTTPACSSGTVDVQVLPGQPTTLCVALGSTVTMTGGSSMSAGTWPGPATISDHRVLTLLTSSSTGDVFTADFRAIGAGTASVDVPFVDAPDVCNPTPCTPVPGAPLMLTVRVVGPTPT